MHKHCDGSFIFRLLEDRVSYNPHPSMRAHHTPHTWTTSGINLYLRWNKIFRARQKFLLSVTSIICKIWFHLIITFKLCMEKNVPTYFVSNSSKESCFEEIGRCGLVFLHQTWGLFNQHSIPYQLPITIPLNLKTHLACVCLSQARRIIFMSA